MKWARCRGQRGAHGMAVGTAAAQLQSGCRVNKMGLGLPKLLTCQKISDISMPSPSVNVGDSSKRVHSTCVGPLHGLCQLPALLWIARPGFPGLPGFSLWALLPFAGLPYPVLSCCWSLFHPSVLSRSAPSHTWESQNHHSCPRTCSVSLYFHRTVWFTDTFVAWPNAVGRSTVMVFGYSVTVLGAFAGFRSAE